MNRIKSLNRYQKGILILMIAMAMIFGVVYAVVTSRTGILYEGSILEFSADNGNDVYSGNIHGEACKFTVTPDKSVVFQTGDRVYGPYYVEEDSTAVPEDNSFGTEMTGIEVRKGSKIIFRGGILELDSFWLMVNEDGTGNMFSFTETMSDGTIVDSEGNVVDPMEPSVATIVDLVYDPELTNKGQWGAWLLGILLSVVTSVTILYADEIFRHNLSYQIQNAEGAEPSEWEITRRYISWTMLPVLTFILYIVGLR